MPISNLELYNPKGISLICTEKRRKQRGYCRLSLRVRGRRFSRSNWSAAALSLNFEAAEEEEEEEEED